MAVEVSAALKRAIYSGNTERVFIQLTEISHDDFPQTYLFTTDSHPTTHNGATYEPIPIEVTLPDSRESVQPQAVLTIPNVSPELVALVRSIQTAADVTIKVVLDDDPDRIERGPISMKLFDVKYDIGSVRGTLRPVSLVNEPFPYAVFNRIEYPAL